MRYSYFHIYKRVIDFLSYAKSMGENISKNVSDKYC